MRQVELDSFMVKRGGSVNPAKLSEEIFELLSIPAFDKGQPEISAGKDIGSSKKKVEPNDVLLSKIVPHIRRCWVVPASGTLRQIASGEWIQFRSDEAFPRYLKFILISDPFHQQFMNTISGVGGSLLRASPARVAKIKIPLPPLTEQQKIADILDAADALRQKDQQLIDHYTALSQSLFLDMFGDPVTNPMEWNKNKLGDLTDLVTDGKHGDCKNEENSGYYFISAKNIRNGIIDYSDSRQITKADFEEVHRRTNLTINDLVMVNTGATIGKIAIANDLIRTNNTTFQKSVAVIKPKKELLSTVFLRYVFQLRINDFASKGSGSAIKNLLLSEMRRFEIITPKLELQNLFAERVAIIEQQKQQTQTNLEQSNNLFNSLLQKAFSGELTQEQTEVA